jgi:RimJ/RimL family protein N-acetyltransferase
LSSVIETARLRLRPFTPDDEAALFEVFADPYARRFYPQMEDPANVRAWIEWNLRNYDDFGFGLWAMELKTTGAFIGDCGLTYQDVEGEPELEIGYHVLESERRRGFATEAARACLDYGFLNTAADSLCSTVVMANEASQIVAERIHTNKRTFQKRGETVWLFFTPRSSWLSLREREGSA